MKKYLGLEIYLHAELTSALGGGEWLPSRPSPFDASATVHITSYSNGHTDILKPVIVS
jgi:hypothetical protein